MWKMLSIKFILIFGYIFANSEGYVFLGCFVFNTTMLSADHGRYVAKDLSASSCSFLCQETLNLSTPFALADTKLCLCDRNVEDFKTWGKVDDNRCRNYCQRSLNDTKYCGQSDTLAVYGAADIKDVTEQPTECKPLEGLVKGRIRYENNRFATVECYNGSFHSSPHRLECQYMNGSFSWIGEIPVCPENSAADEMDYGFATEDKPTTAITLGVVFGFIAVSVIVSGAIFSFFKKKRSSSSFTIRRHSSKRLRPTIERVDGDGTHAPDTGNTHFTTAQREQTGQSVEEKPLEHVPIEEHNAGYDHLPPNPAFSCRDDFANPPNEQPLDRNSANRSTYNFVTPPSTEYGPLDEEDDDEEYDHPSLEPASYEQGSFEPGEDMTFAPEPESAFEHENSQILMNIDMTHVLAPKYSMVSKERYEDENVMREQMYVKEEEEQQEDFYLQPDL